MKKLTTEEFIQKCGQLHENKYDYRNTVYINNDTKVQVHCLMHGIFSISAKNHMNGQGCKECGYEYRDDRRATTEEFLEKARNTHGNRYNYSSVVYTTAREYIDIECPIHGLFRMRAMNHLIGQGCGKCNNYRSGFSKSQWMRGSGSRKGTFYVIKCWKNDEEFHKFGITFRSVELRYGKKKRGEGALLPYHYEIIKEVRSDNLEYIWKLEKRFKSMKEKQRYVPLLKFPGSTTECFTLEK